MTRRLWVLPLALLGACAGKAKNDVTVVPPGAQVEQIEMDPIKIAAVKGPDGTHLETYDVTELFERAGKALSDKRPADAARDYDQLLKEFPDTRYTKAALYNAGLAYEALKDWQTAVVRFSKLASEHADSSDAKDALFQIGACYAELGNWPDLGHDLRPDPGAQGPERGRQDRGDGPARATRSSSSRTSTPPSAPSSRPSTTTTASPARSASRPTSTWGWSATSWERSPTSASGPFSWFSPKRRRSRPSTRRRCGC